MKRKKYLIEYCGETYSLNKLSKKLKMSPKTLKKRMDDGWSIEQIADTPVDRRRRSDGNGQKCKANNIKECFYCALPDCYRSSGRPLDGELKYYENSENMR